MKTVDTKTRHQAVFARHQVHCALTGGGERCNCTPRYFGTVWDRDAGRPRKTRYFSQVVAARDARDDLRAALRQGEPVRGEGGIGLGDALDTFVKAAGDGVALNKRRRRYRPRSVEDLKSIRKHIPERLAKRKLTDVKRGDLQALADELSADRLSGSRVRTVINGLRSLYSWAQDRELASHDPAQRVRLPAMEKDEEKKRGPRDALRDSVPFALAGYAGARRQEIQHLDWQEVDFKLDGLELAADEQGRKPGGSWRIVPMAAPLRSILREEWLAQGRPKAGKVCPPRRGSKSGLVALATLQKRVHERWRELKLQPIGLHEARHTLATWLDHAGVSPKVASQIMGHKTPEYQAGAAKITLERYTHVLPGELERARDLLDKFLAERSAEAVDSVRGR
jgi:integrase